jgi:hypothetical protein
MTKIETLSNKSYEIKLKDALSRIADFTNIKFDVVYNETSKTFTFQIPDDEKFIDPTIELPLGLGERIGFGLHKYINRRYFQGQPVENITSDNDALKKSRSLCFDTMIVIVSDMSQMSYMTRGVPYKFMAMLSPTVGGTLETTFEKCKSVPLMTISLNQCLPDDSNYMTTFKLSRAIENNEYVDLIWKNGAYISGILNGFKINKRVKLH